MGSSVVTSPCLHVLLLQLLLVRFSTATLSSDGVKVLPLVDVSSHVELDGIEEETESIRTCIYGNIVTALVQARITREKINAFKDNYTREKFNSKWEDVDHLIPNKYDEDMLEVCTSDRTCSTVLPSLPPPSTPPPATDIEAAQMFTDMSSNILRFLYAYEQMVLDQAIKEDSFARQMHDAYTNYDQLVSLLEEVQEACGLQPNTSALASLRGKMYVNTNDMQTDKRGFCTLRQSLQGLNLLLDMFWVDSNNAKKMEDDVKDEERKDVRRKRKSRRRRMKDSRDKKNGKIRKRNMRSRRRRND